ncbi:MAG: DNA polymerase Y family protein [Planctomycetaceae bacterium]|nr:DNA polymerase Y family protein [Planctomycetaceae bacterium]
MRRIACIRWNNGDCRSPTDGSAGQADRCPSDVRQLAERCRKYSPLVGWEATDKSLLLDITGVAHLFGGEPALGKAIVREMGQLGLSVRVALADTVGAAWAAARYGDLPVSTNPSICSLQSSLLIVSSRATATFLSPLPVEGLRLPEETVRLLRELGLRSIGQLEEVPREGFLSRFGPLLLRRLDQAFGRLDEPVCGSEPLPRFAAQWIADYPITKREMIEAVVEHLVRRVAAMLAQHGRGTLRLECRLAMEGLNPNFELRHLSLSVGLFQPTSAAGHLFELLKLQLEPLRIPSPVGEVRVTATLIAPLEPLQQGTLFDAHNDLHHKKKGDGAHLTALIERLSSRLGATAVVGVRLRPEAQPELAWHYDPLVGNRRRGSRMTRSRDRGITERGTTGKDRDATEQVTLPPRPLRLLMRPRLLDCGAGAPALFRADAPQTPPSRFRLDGREYQLTRHWGPERIETGWWRGQPIGRDYYRVETVTGSRYWLFRRLRDGKWFLHGVFE